jgi:hypothetical protein
MVDTLSFLDMEVSLIKLFRREVMRDDLALFSPQRIALVKRNMIAFSQ